MTGGLLQLVTSGKQDIYLTSKPEITFFKKVYRRHTNFSIELKDIASEQQSNYDSISTFIINNQADALFRCYLEVDLPLVSFPDTYIQSQTYFDRKTTDIGNLNTQITSWSTLYNNLKGFVDIEMILYRTLKLYLNTDNVTINILKNAVTNYNYLNKTIKDVYKNKIDGSVYNMINISGYISSITLLITTDTTYDASIYISNNDISTNIDNLYNNMLYYLNFYNNKINMYTDMLNNKTSSSQINFNYAEFLGHNFFDYFSLEIGGQEIEQYSKDHLHISQLHHIKQDYIPNYLEMIGHDPLLNTFNSNPKGGRKIIVPLIFWFNKDAGSSLPLIALQYPSIVLNAKISALSNIICFQDFIGMYKKLLHVDIPYDKTNKISLNANLIYSNYNVDIVNKVTNYNCLYINDELLKYQFPDLSSNDRSIILENNGSLYTLNDITSIMNPNMSTDEIAANNGPNGLNTQYLINQNQWLLFMQNINKPLYINIASKVASYYPYIDFNLYYSLVKQPNVRLIGEFIYLDDVERGKFANSKLEYIIETYDEDIYNINNDSMFNCELSFIKPCKQLSWYIQPTIFVNGLSNYGQNTSLLFDYSKYFVNPLVSSQSLIFGNYELLFQNVDDNYYTYLQSYKYLNNILVPGIYYKSFALYPEESQPSGTVNLRQIKAKNYGVQINKDFLKEYYNNPNGLNPKNNSLMIKFMAKSYDLFVVHKGFARLLFSI
jgi:hypothetical protein